MITNNLQISLNEKNIVPGTLIRIEYKVPEGDKERVQYYEGIVISIQNKGISKTIKIRRILQGIGLVQTFFIKSPKIISIVSKQKYKVRRAKLYFISNFKGKSQRLKIIK